jgi:hypothetical protein
MIEMDVNEWVEGLLAELKSKSTRHWDGKPGDMAMPVAIGRIITNHSEMIEPELRRAYCEQAISRFNQLIEQGDPYAGTLSRASAHLAHLGKREQERLDIGKATERRPPDLEKIGSGT